jgi:hypothetical protein
VRRFPYPRPVDLFESPECRDGSPKGLGASGNDYLLTIQNATDIRAFDQAGPLPAEHNRDKGVGGQCPPPVRPSAGTTGPRCRTGR